MYIGRWYWYYVVICTTDINISYVKISFHIWKFSNFLERALWTLVFLFSVLFCCLQICNNIKNIHTILYVIHFYRILFALTATLTMPVPHCCGCETWIYMFQEYYPFFSMKYWLFYNQIVSIHAVKRRRFLGVLMLLLLGFVPTFAIYIYVMVIHNVLKEKISFFLCYSTPVSVFFYIFYLMFKCICVLFLQDSLMYFFIFLIFLFYLFQMPFNIK